VRRRYGAETVHRTPTATRFLNLHRRYRRKLAAVSAARAIRSSTPGVQRLPVDRAVTATAAIPEGPGTPTRPRPLQ